MIASSGRQVWASRHPGSDPRAVTLTPVGDNAFVTGYGGHGSTAGYATIAYNAATGTRR